MKKMSFILAVIICSLSIASNTVYAQKAGMVKVYRWYIPDDNEYVIAAEDAYTPEQIKERGWKKKAFMFYGYKERQPNSVAVYNWYHPVYHSRLTIREDEFSEKTLHKMGYTRGRFQFYALTLANDNTVCVYRCRRHNSHSWVSITENEYIDDIEDKEYQYYAIAVD